MRISGPFRGLRLLTFGALAPLIALLLFQATPGAQAQWLNPFVHEISTGGFGDSKNSYAWSMAWFKGKLYVGTARQVLCVERATQDFYFPGLGFYTTEPLPGMGMPVTCPADRYDLDLRAEIWEYTPATNTWRRAFQSPNDIQNPRAPGKFVARDIGFRNMIVYTPPGGVETLFIGGVTTDEYIPELAATNPPRILRTTDGVAFTPLNGAPGILDSKFGMLRPIGYRAMAVFDGRLFATASTSLVGDGVIVEIGDPAGPNPTFTQVSPNTLAVYELEVFNNFLYAGTGDANLTTGQGTGYGVYKTKATGGKPYQFTPVVTGGAGRGVTITSVVSMHPFKGRLYIGAGSLACEMIRINPNDTWDVVVGNPRTTAAGFKWPISGLPDGFGNPFNAHVWRMRDHQGILFAGTNDWSYAFHAVPEHFLDPLLGYQYGFDIYSSPNGWFWFLGTQDAFGNGINDFGARTLVSSPVGAFIGSTSHLQGTTVWSSVSSSASVVPPGAPSSALAGGIPADGPDEMSLALARLIVGAESDSGAAGEAGPAIEIGASSTSIGWLADDTSDAPSRLLAEVSAGSTILSWEPAPAATRYRVLRADFQSNKDLKLPAPRGVPAIERSLRVRQTPDDWKLPDDTWIPGPFKPIGSTADLFYVDRSAKDGVRYAYQVQAENSPGGLSDPSNVAVVPLLTPVVEIADVRAQVSDLAQRGMIKRASASRAAALVQEATGNLGRGDLASTKGKVQALRQLINQQRGKDVDDLAAEDLDITWLKFNRRVELAQGGLLTLAGQGDGDDTPAPTATLTSTATANSTATPRSTQTPRPTATPRPTRTPNPGR